jgi:hypothetical protein
MCYKMCHNQSSKNASPTAAQQDLLVQDADTKTVVGGRAVDARAASASQMGRFETETLALPENREALADLNGQWIDRFHDRNGLKYIVLMRNWLSKYLKSREKTHRPEVSATYSQGLQSRVPVTGQTDQILIVVSDPPLRGGRWLTLSSNSAKIYTVDLNDVNCSCFMYQNVGRANDIDCSGRYCAHLWRKAREPIFPK